MISAACWIRWCLQVSRGCGPSRQRSGGGGDESVVLNGAVTGAGVDSALQSEMQ